MAEISPLEIIVPEKKPDFIVVTLTDGDAPRHIRWGEVIGVTDWTGDAEAHYVLYLSSGAELRVKSQNSFAIIAERLKD